MKPRRFTTQDVARGDLSALSARDRMSLEFGGTLSPEGQQFMRDTMSLQFGGSVSQETREAFSRAMDVEFGSRPQR